MLGWIKTHPGEAGLALLSLLGGWLYWLGTHPWGIGVEYDSIFYLSASDNLLMGNGLSRLDGYGTVYPMIHFPPGYPVVVALLSFVFGIETLLSARILAALFLVVLIGLVGWLTLKFTDSGWAAGMVSVFMLSSPVIWEVFIKAMSEPMFLVLILAALWQFYKFVFTEAAPPIWVLSVLAVGAYMFRYSGLSLIVFGGLAILLYREASLKERAVEILKFGLIALALALPWMTHNWLLTGSFTNRVFRVHYPSNARLLQGVKTVMNWLVPAYLPDVVRAGGAAVIILALAGIYFWQWKKYRAGKLDHEDRSAFKFVTFLGGYGLVYIAMVLFSLSFLDASTKLYDRILSPVYVCGVLLAFILVWRSGSFSKRSSGWRIGVLIILLFLTVGNFLNTAEQFASSREIGVMFTGAEWQSSETMGLVDEIPLDVVIISNEAFIIDLLTERTANGIPEKYDSVKRAPNADYAKRMETLRIEVLSGKVVLVIFDTIAKYDAYPTVEEISEGLYLWRDTEDGAIYTAPDWSP